MKRIIIYATTKDGDGLVSEMGRYDDIEDIRIVVGMWADDVVISFDYEKEDNE